MANLELPAIIGDVCETRYQLADAGRVHIAGLAEVEQNFVLAFTDQFPKFVAEHT